jgi:hypothetical protein
MLLFAWTGARADLTNCEDLYVGRIWVQQGSGALYAVVFLNSPSDASGSHWVFFNNWTQDEEKAALSLLMAAKLAQHRVNVATTEANGCGIYQANTFAKSLFLANYQ